MRLFLRNMGRLLCQGVNIVLACYLFWLVFNWVGLQVSEREGRSILFGSVVATIPALMMFGITSNVIGYIFRPRFKGW